MKLRLMSNGRDYSVYVPGINPDMFGLSKVLETSGGISLKIATEDVGVFDMDGSEVRIMRSGHIIIKDKDKKSAKLKAAKLISLMSQSLGMDLVLES